MKRWFILWLALCGTMLSLPPTNAHPYASGVTNIGGSISWVLNESATDIKILFDNGSLTNDLGSAPVVGTNTFTLSTHTNFSIVVFKVGSNVLNQISSDAAVNNQFYGPRGVTVNKNPRSGNFGRVYVASSNPGTTRTGRTTTKGIYALDAASGDFLGLGNSASLAGMSLAAAGTGTNDSPYKLFVGPDDSLYVGDAGNQIIGGVWIVNPSLTASTNIFGLANPSTNTVTGGTNFGRAVGTPNVSGSLAGSNLVLTVCEWDLNLANPPGTFNSAATSYNNIYKYNIGAGPLPWKSYPTVITNPIAIGTVNTVGIDAEVAPDGKIFITALRARSNDGNTNVCVLSTNGTLLWDSKTQSANYFGDTNYDHLSMYNWSISVSPDDQYVCIQGLTNSQFILMALTNGIPDISTLTTNLTAGASGGVTSYSSTWDAADNIYVTGGGSETLRIFSPGLTTTCITSNTVAGTNGSFSITSVSAAQVTIQNQPLNQNVQCGSNATFSVTAYGTGIGYQWYAGTALIPGATNSILNLGAVFSAQSGNDYQVIVSNSVNSVTCVAVLTVSDTIPPVITLNGSSTVYVLQGGTYSEAGATALDSCAGSVGVTTSGSVNTSVAGSYSINYVATDPSGNAVTNQRTVLVLSTNGPATIQSQPSNQLAQCVSPVTFNVIASGALPLRYQWYFNTNALTDSATISGSSTASLTLNAPTASQAGNYFAVISNTFNTVTSQVAILTLTNVSTPVVTVFGSTVVNLAQGSTFIDAGATAADACVGALPVYTNGSVNLSRAGTYVLTYSATNASGLFGSAQRTVIINPTNGPIATAAPAIIPLPVTLQPNAGTFTLCPSQIAPPAPAHATTKILVDGASLSTGQYLAAMLFKSTGYQFQVLNSTTTNAIRGAILITSSNALSSLGAEGYELTVAPDSVVIRAPASAGTFYGVQSLLQLLPPQIFSPRIVTGTPWVAPCVYVQDQPRFAWRGVMLDVARHFIDKQQVEQIIDTLAYHKLNVMHWHLVDDNGWRLEITNYPALTSIGAWRNGIDYGANPRVSPATNSAGQYGGFYTQAQIREVVVYAQARHIMIMPEIEMPCHSTAALAAYPQFGCGNAGSVYNMDYPGINYSVDLFSPGTPGTYAFLEEILTEVMALFPCPYIHCGGDEVKASGDTQWNTYGPDMTNMTALGITPNGSTSVVAYQYCFSTNIAAFLQANGRMMMGWDDIDANMVLTNMALASAETGTSSRAIQAAEAGVPVVMSPSTALYINYEETTTNIEPTFVVGGKPAYNSLSTVYNFEPIPTNLPTQYNTNIIGAQCNLWSEYVPSYENFLFKLYPRMCALAELSWSPKASKNYSSFTNRLVTHEQRFAQMGINYNHETIPQIGTWGPTVSTSPTTMDFDITTNVTAAGEIDVNFWYTSGSSLAISSVSLLQNGVPVDSDVHAGLSGPYSTYSGAPFVPIFTVYVLHLPETKPGATYTIRAVFNGSGGTSSTGIVYLPNWN